MLAPAHLWPDHTEPPQPNESPERLSTYTAYVCADLHTARLLLESGLDEEADNYLEQARNRIYELGGCALDYCDIASIYRHSLLAPEEMGARERRQVIARALDRGSYREFIEQARRVAARSLGTGTVVDRLRPGAKGN